MASWVVAAAGVLGLVAGVLVSARLAGRPLASAWKVRVRRPRDVIVPLLSAIPCAAFAARFGLAPVLPAYLYLALVSMPLAAIDASEHRLPDVLTLPSYPIAVGLLAAAVPFVPNGLHHLVTTLVGLAALWAFYFVLSLVSPEGLGWGDVKLAGVLGAYLGWLGAQTWVLGAFLGVLFGGLYALALLVTRRATRKTKIAFGPFLIAGTLVAVAVSAALVP